MNIVSPKAQTKVAEICKLLKERAIIPCSHGRLRCVGDSEVFNCPHREHDFTGYIPDPDYNWLRELVEKTCPTCEGKGLDIYCDGTGRVTRNWTHYFRGSLRGVVEFGNLLPKGWEIQEFNSRGKDGIVLTSYLRTLDGGVYYLNGDDPDIAIITAILQALTAQLDAKI